MARKISLKSRLDILHFLFHRFENYSIGSESGLRRLPWFDLCQELRWSIPRTLTPNFRNRLARSLIAWRSWRRHHSYGSSTVNEFIFRGYCSRLVWFTCGSLVARQIVSSIDRALRFPNYTYLNQGPWHVGLDQIDSPIFASLRKDNMVIP